jgi:hypothetical protein
MHVFLLHAGLRRFFSLLSMVNPVDLAETSSDFNLARYLGFSSLSLRMWK